MKCKRCRDALESVRTRTFYYIGTWVSPMSRDNMRMPLPCRFPGKTIFIPSYIKYCKNYIRMLLESVLTVKTPASACSKIYIRKKRYLRPYESFRASVCNEIYIRKKIFVHPYAVTAGKAEMYLTAGANPCVCFPLNSDKG